MNVFARIFFTCIAVCMCLLYKCSTDSTLSADTDGSGTQTTNGICVLKGDNYLSGYAFSVGPDSSQKVLRGRTSITLRLLSSDFQPYDGKGYDTIVHLDSAGIFEFNSLQDGYYNLMATDTLDSVSLLFQVLPVFDSIVAYTKTLLLARTGALEGIINDSSSVDAYRRGVYIAGTPFFSLADSLSGAFHFSGVPAGSYLLKADYFIKTRGSGYVRLKGIMQGIDTLTVYTDSIGVIVSPDSVSRSLNLGL